jgi:hypothetical protein
LIAAAVILVIIAAAILIPGLLKKNKSVNAALYLKDGEINYSSLTGINPKEITDQLSGSSSDTSDFGYYIGYSITFSSDGKRIFYPDRFNDNSEGMTIYYQNLNSKTLEGEKIDSEISQYRTNDAGTKIFYIKGEENDLYVSNLKEKEKLDSNVSAFYVSSDGSKVIYCNDDGNIYEKDGSKDIIKLDSNSSIQYVSEDLTTLYYLKGDTLYLKKGNKDKEKLLTDVTNVVSIYETGEIYYLKENGADYLLSDYVNDDMLAWDQTITEPVEPVYPNYYDYQPDTEYPVEPDYYSFADYWGYVDWDAYDAAYNEYYAAVDEYNAQWDEAYNTAVADYNSQYDAYLAALEEYNAKLNRDSIRANIEGVTIPVTKYTLSYYDSKKSFVITDNYYTNLDYSSQKPVLLYQNLNESGIPKLNLSEYTSYDDLYSMATNSLFYKTENYSAVGSESKLLNQESGTSYYLKEDGSAFYYLDNYNETADSSDLYEITITDNKPGDPVLAEEDVSNVSLLYDGNSLIYFKNVNNMEGDLYLNKKPVDSEVYIYSAYIKEGTDELMYFVDFNSDTQLGTLKLYNSKDKIKIGDDINSYCVVSDKYITCLMDYDVNAGKGDLYVYDGSDKKKQIDTDVTSIISIYENSYRGDYSYLWE